jgi:hypothetical protein
MRMMMKVTIPTDAGNKAILDGSLPKIMMGFAEQFKPEAAFFSSDNGDRAAFFFFEMADATQMPAACEPFFLHLNAKIQLSPAMTPADMQSGIAKAMKHS